MTVCYYVFMKRLRLFSPLITPSIFSGTLVFILGTLILIFSNASFLVNSGLLYQTLLGKSSSQDFIASSHDTVSLFTQNVFENPALTKVLFFGFWMMIGLFAYISVVSISSLLQETTQDLAAAHYIHAQAQRVKERLVLRIATRMAASFAIFFWSWIFLRFLLPFCTLAVRVGLNQSRLSSAVYVVLGGLVMTMSLHMFVILLRLVALRPRIFSSYVID